MSKCWVWGVVVFVAAACADSSKGGETVRPGMCTPGETRECVGAAACRGGQQCGEDERWGECDCGSSVEGSEDAGSENSAGSPGTRDPRSDDDPDAGAEVPLSGEGGTSASPEPAHEETGGAPATPPEAGGDGGAAAGGGGDGSATPGGAGGLTATGGNAGGLAVAGQGGAESGGSAGAGTGGTQVGGSGGSGGQGDLPTEWKGVPLDDEQAARVARCDDEPSYFALACGYSALEAEPQFECFHDADCDGVACADGVCAISCATHDGCGDYGLCDSTGQCRGVPFCLGNSPRILDDEDPFPLPTGQLLEYWVNDFSDWCRDSSPASPGFPTNVRVRVDVALGATSALSNSRGSVVEVYVWLEDGLQAPVVGGVIQQRDEQGDIPQTTYPELECEQSAWDGGTVWLCRAGSASSVLEARGLSLFVESLGTRAYLTKDTTGLACIRPTCPL